MDCKSWLESFLGEEPKLCDAVKLAAVENGFTRKQLKEARHALGVKTFHQFDKGPTPNWFWYLEDKSDA